MMITLNDWLVDRIKGIGNVDFHSLLHVEHRKLDVLNIS